MTERENEARIANNLSMIDGMIKELDSLKVQNEQAYAYR